VGYILRAAIHEKHWERQLKGITDVCKKAGIKEVLLMEQSHAIMMVPFPMEKHKRMASIYKTMARELRKKNIEYSINIASLIGHGDANVRDEYVLPYQKHVGENLKEARAVYCMLDEGWQDYAAEVCALYAAEKPAKLFVDDDFRCLNHTSLFGCFCPIHVRETSKECGIELAAESLIKSLAGSSEQDMRIKEAWLKVTFRGQLESARKIRNAVHKVSPGTQIGLMNSGEAAHSVQGRDMEKLLREFAGPDHRPLTRPSGGEYWDVQHDELFYMHQGTALSMKEAGPDAYVISEVENAPHTRYTKSITTTRLQMELHTLAGADDLSLNIFDYLATPYEQEPGFIEMLAESRERLAVIKEARKGKKLVGFGLPWKKNTAEKCFSRCNDLSDIMPNLDINDLLPQLGIPTQFDIARGNAIVGDAIQCYDDAEILELLKGGLLIDGTAFEHLTARGFGHLLGCRLAGYIKGPCVERLDENEFSGRFAGNYLSTSWIRLEAKKKPICRLEPLEGARVISTIVDDELNDIACGTVLYENELGGRVAVFPSPFMARNWIYRCRAYQIAKIVNWLMYDELPVWVEDCPSVGPFYYEDEKTGEGLLGVLNASLDPATINLHTKYEVQDLFDKDRKDMEIEPLSLRLFKVLKHSC